MPFTSIAVAPAAPATPVALAAAAIARPPSTFTVPADHDNAGAQDCR